MVAALAILLSCQLAGEALVRLTGLRLSGTVVGLLLLLALLAVWPRALVILRDTAHTLVAHLALFFIPAGVGVMLHGERLRTDGAPILVAIVFGTALTMAVTAVVFDRLSR